MLRSLFSSISGLRNHQVRMDVIGNNIANVNTTGYKTTRVTFEESLSQLLSGSTRPPGDLGGTNPMQVGLGMSIGSVDVKHTQGNLESTGQITDLSIEGKAFFAVSNGEGNFYTRNGAFQFDSEGRMVLPTNGMVLQGKMADTQGTFPPGTVVGGIKIPFNDQAPAQATTEINFARNLDLDSGAKGSVLYTQKFFHHAENTDLIHALHESTGKAVGIQTGDILTFSAVNAANTTTTASFTVTETTTMADVLNAMQTFLRDPTGPDAGAGTTVQMVTTPDDVNNNLDYRGGVTIFGNASNAIQNFQVTSNRPISGPLVTKAFSMPTTIPVNSAQFDMVTDTLRSPAQSTDRLAELFDGNGNGLGLENNDSISINGSVGGKNVTALDPLLYAPGDPENPAGTPATTASGTTLQDLLNQIKDTFQLPERDTTPERNLSVSVNSGGSDDNIPDGTIVVRGMPEKAFALQNIAVTASNSNNSTPSPSAFISNLSFQTLQQARDTGVFDTSIVVYDEMGQEHTATMKFTHTGTPNNWLWEIQLGGQEEIMSGGTGTLSFGQDGSVSAFSYDNDAAQLTFDPKNGAPVVRANLRVGGPGDFRGLTQFRSPTTASAVRQDGYTMGRLREISINDYGLITGSFTNGVSKSLAQIMIVDFTNPQGLLRMKDSVYTVSPNSGDPIFGMPGTQSASLLKPGSLELSNVELAQEFTDMITTQRGYQANARVITVSDSLLEELVALKR